MHTGLADNSVLLKRNRSALSRALRRGPGPSILALHQTAHMLSAGSGRPHTSFQGSIVFPELQSRSRSAELPTKKAVSTSFASAIFQLYLAQETSSSQELHSRGALFVQSFGARTLQTLSSNSLSGSKWYLCLCHGRVGRCLRPTPRPVGVH